MPATSPWNVPSANRHVDLTNMPSHSAPSARQTAWCFIAIIASGEDLSLMRLSSAAVKWAGDRKISRQTLEELGVASGTKFGKEVLCFPYVRGSEIVNTKYRTISEKTFSMREGGELRFWNLDAVLSGSLDQVLIVEGEMDALAAREAGVRLDGILSVPN